jgi:hypothetical protein
VRTTAAWSAVRVVVRPPAPAARVEQARHLAEELRVTMSTAGPASAGTACNPSTHATAQPGRHPASVSLNGDDSTKVAVACLARGAGHAVPTAPDSSLAPSPAMCRPPLSEGRFTARRSSYRRCTPAGCHSSISVCCPGTPHRRARRLQFTCTCDHIWTVAQVRSQRTAESGTARLGNSAVVH